MDFAHDRKSIRRLEKQAAIVDAQRAAVIHNTMSTIEGRQWLWDVLATCHCFSSTFNGDALQSAFAEGQRSIGLAILADIMLACPDYYIQAMRESNERSSIASARAATDERRRSEDLDWGDSRPVDPTDSAADGTYTTDQ